MTAQAPIPCGTAATPANSGLAIASMVLGIMGFCTGISGIVGIILGIVAISQINNSRGAMGGKGFATAGIITGAVSVVLYAIWIIIWIAIGFAGILGN